MWAGIIDSRQIYNNIMRVSWQSVFRTKGFANEEKGQEADFPRLEAKP